MNDPRSMLAYFNFKAYFPKYIERIVSQVIEHVKVIQIYVPKIAQIIRCEDA